MLEPDNLLQLALDMGGCSFTSETEAVSRRAISTAYYAVFHRLAQAAAKNFGNAGDAVQRQAERALNHGEMRRVCEAFRRWPVTGRIEPPYDKMLSSVSDRRLADLADGFVKLQEARHRADYDMHSTVTSADLSEALRLLVRTWSSLQDIEAHPDTQVFLAALILDGRWNRGGQG